MRNSNRVSKDLAGWRHTTQSYGEMATFHTQLGLNIDFVLEIRKLKRVWVFLLVAAIDELNSYWTEAVRYRYLEETCRYLQTGNF